MLADCFHRGAGRHEEAAKEIRLMTKDERLSVCVGWEESSIACDRPVTPEALYNQNDINSLLYCVGHGRFARIGQKLFYQEPWCYVCIWLMEAILH